MIKTKLCNCPEECNHESGYYFSPYELGILYDYLKHQYISYNNLLLIKLVEQMGKEVNVKQ